MGSQTARVLYIDDEENNLEAFKASYRRQYEIYTATSAEAGLKILQNVEIHVIISDQKMPKMTGVEFFQSIIKIYPDPIRLLLTGFTDIEALAGAVNEGEIYRYLTKPWVDADLHSSLRSAYEAYRTKVDLRNKVAELEKVNDELNRFIYSISHELRAPLVSVIGIVNLVKMENMYNSSGEYWSLVETCSNKLDYYIQKTLQYYKNSKTISETVNIDFKDLVKELIDIYAYTDKETQFIVNIDQKIPFKGDLFRIEVILGNLISNAIKYQKVTEINKKVIIDVLVGQELVEISITDNGMGILNDHLEKIFTQFFKSKIHHGSGLGLFIVKEALNKINGRIAVSSDIDYGTTFTITIPNAK
jgi:signal transduction histidine kinase